MLSKKERVFFAEPTKEEFNNNYRNVIMCRVRKKLKCTLNDLRLILNAENPYEHSYLNPLEVNEIKKIHKFLADFYTTGRYGD